MDIEAKIRELKEKHGLVGEEAGRFETMVTTRLASGANAAAANLPSVGRFERRYFREEADAADNDLEADMGAATPAVLAAFKEFLEAEIQDAALAALG